MYTYIHIYIYIYIYIYTYTYIHVYIYIYIMCAGLPLAIGIRVMINRTIDVPRLAKTETLQEMQRQMPAGNKSLNKKHLIIDQTKKQ